MVVDVAPRDYPDLARWTHFAALLRLDLHTLRSRQDAEDRLAAEVPDLGLRKFLVTNLVMDAAGRWRWTVNLPALAAAMPALEKSPLAPEDRSAGPTLFVRGANSGYIRPEDEGAIRRHFPAAQVVTLAGAGHNPHLDRREAFVQTVRSG